MSLLYCIFYLLGKNNIGFFIKSQPHNIQKNVSHKNHNSISLPLRQNLFLQPFKEALHKWKLQGFLSRIKTQPQPHTINLNINKSRLWNEKLLSQKDLLKMAHWSLVDNGVQTSVKKKSLSSFNWLFFPSNQTCESHRLQIIVLAQLITNRIIARN